MVNKITIDVRGQLADKWSCDWIKVDRIVGTEGAVDGSSTFFIGEDLGYSPTAYSEPIKQPMRVIFTQTGDSESSVAIYSKAVVASSFGETTAQEHLKLTQSWRETNSVIATKSEKEFSSQELGFEIGAGYKPSDNTGGGYFDFKLYANFNWATEKTSIIETSKIKDYLVEYDNSITVSPNTVTFQRVNFSIPCMSQTYSISDQRNQSEELLLWKVNGPISMESSILKALPLRDKDNNIVPYEWDSLEKEFLSYMIPSAAEEVRNMKTTLLTLNYVKDNSAATPRLMSSDNSNARSSKNSETEEKQKTSKKESGFCKVIRTLFNTPDPDSLDMNMSIINVGNKMIMSHDTRSDNQSNPTFYKDKLLTSPSTIFQVSILKNGSYAIKNSRGEFLRTCVDCRSVEGVSTDLMFEILDPKKTDNAQFNLQKVGKLTYKIKTKQGTFVSSCTNCQQPSLITTSDDDSKSNVWEFVHFD